MRELLLNSLLVVLWLAGCVWGPYRKGYNPLFFVFGGLATLLVLAFPPLHEPGEPALAGGSRSAPPRKRHRPRGFRPAGVRGWLAVPRCTVSSGARMIYTGFF